MHKRQLLSPNTNPYGLEVSGLISSWLLEAPASVDTLHIKVSTFIYNLLPHHTWTLGFSWMPSSGISFSPTPLPCIQLPMIGRRYSTALKLGGTASPELFWKDYLCISDTIFPLEILHHSISFLLVRAHSEISLAFPPYGVKLPGGEPLL